MTGSHRQTAGRGAVLRALLLLNVALLAVLAAVTFGARADAQLRPRGNYTMVGGTVPGLESGAVFIVDTVNQELVAVTYDPNAQGIAGLGYRNLAVDAATTTGSRNR